jgi:acyl-CoA reductase-like NAD-dependent aldehyde dehydrogenase
MVAMTGSSAVGKHIMAQCATSLKRLVLELGGKDPMIVFRDADLDLAAADAVKYSLYNAGQVCCSVERIYVDESIRSQFEQKVLQIASTQYHVAPNNKNNDDPTKTEVGPLVSSMQRNSVQGQVDDAVQQGATLLYQSEIPPSNTHYFPITVLSNLKQTMMIQTQETFGPVVAISTFDGSEMDAIRLANDSEYGLSSSVYTLDLEKAKRVSRNIQSGQVGINCYPLEHANVACPWYVIRNDATYILYIRNTVIHFFTLLVTHLFSVFLIS